MRAIILLTVSLFCLVNVFADIIYAHAASGGDGQASFTEVAQSELSPAESGDAGLPCKRPCLGDAASLCQTSCVFFLGTARSPFDALTSVRLLPRRHAEAKSEIPPVDPGPPKFPVV